MKTRILELVVVAYIGATLVLIAARSYLPVQVFEPPYLSIVLQIVFVGFGFLALAYLSGQTYRRTGNPLFLLLGTSLVTFATGDLVSYGYYQYSSNANFLATVFALTFFLSDLGLLLSISLLFTNGRSGNRPTNGTYKAVVAYGLALFIVLVIAFATSSGYFPVFFQPGVGGTPIRSSVLVAAVVILIPASIWCFKRYIDTRSIELLWLSSAIVLFADGQTAALFTKAAGSVLSWTGRIAILLSGLYFIVVFLGMMAATSKENDKGESS